MESSVLVKAFRLLETMAAEQGEKSLGELARLSRLTKPTAHRILSTLSDLGYVCHGDGGVYRLGDRLVRIVLGREQERLVSAGRAVLTALRDATGETVNLGVIQHGRVAYLLSLESTYPLRRVAGSNETHPFHCTALGRAIAANLPESQQKRLLAGYTLQRRTPHTLVDSRALRQVLEQTRAQGYAVEENETDPGVTCIGAPVFEKDRVVAAVSVSAPSSRAVGSVREELIRSIRDAAERLSTLISREEPVPA